MVVFLALVDEYIQRGCLNKTIKSLNMPETSELLMMLDPLVHDVRYS